VPDAPLRDGVVALSVNRRFAAAGGIAALAAAIQAGDGAAALALLRAGGPDVTFVEVDDDARLTGEQLADVRADVRQSSSDLYAAASAGDGSAALGALEQHRLLCAHRAGPRGVQHWSDAAATWSAEVHDVVARADGHYLGQPLLVTSNDYDIDLYNGDTGVVVDDGRGGLIAVFGRGGAPFTVPLARLGAVRPLHAMTIHRAQGSQFTTVSVLLPAAQSPLATRETLYTAVTRAMEHVRVIGSASALERAVSQPAARATGLRDRLSGRIS
jgi:exodeoxyribonuclease V alpha subunit